MNAFWRFHILCLTNSWKIICVACMAGAGVFCVSSLNAAGAIEASLDKAKVTVGEPFVYTINLLLPRGAEANLPGEKASFKGLEIRNYQPQYIPQPDGSQQLVLRYTLVSFDVGRAGIKDFRISVRRPDGTIEKWLAPPVEITIASVLPEKGAAQPKGFVGPIMLSTSWQDWLWAALIALLIATALIGFLMGRRRRAAQQTLQKLTESLLSPDEAALQALQRLEQEELLAEADFQSFYLRLAEILRAWLQARFDVPALERTTRGLMYLLRVRREMDIWRKDVIDLLRTADGVKFAKLLPTPEEAQKQLLKAREIIQIVAARERQTAEADASQNTPAPLARRTTG